MTTYASNTDVSSYRSREEIERTLMRYGAANFAYGVTETHALIGFTMSDRQIRFILPLPNRNSSEFTLTPTKKWARSDKEAAAAYEQAVKSKWRSLALVIKAKLEAVSSQIVTFEQEFGMHMVLPDGRTVAEHVVPEIATAYATGEIPPLFGSMDSKPALSRGAS